MKKLARLISLGILFYGAEVFAASSCEETRDIVQTKGIQFETTIRATKIFDATQSKDIKISGILKVKYPQACIDNSVPIFHFKTMDFGPAFSLTIGQRTYVGAFLPGVGGKANTSITAGLNNSIWLRELGQAVVYRTVMNDILRDLGFDQFESATGSFVRIFNGVSDVLSLKNASGELGGIWGSAHSDDIYQLLPRSYEISTAIE